MEGHNHKADEDVDHEEGEDDDVDHVEEEDVSPVVKDRSLVLSIGVDGCIQDLWPPLKSLGQKENVTKTEIRVEEMKPERRRV